MEIANDLVFVFLVPVFQMLYFAFVDGFDTDKLVLDFN